MESKWLVWRPWLSQRPIRIRITSFDSIFNVRDGFHAVPDGLIGELAGDHGTNLRLDYASPGLRIHNDNSRAFEPGFCFFGGDRETVAGLPYKSLSPQQAEVGLNDRGVG